MPWTPSDASQKTHFADDPAKKAKWAAISNALLKRTGDDAQAIRIANAAVHYGLHAAKRK